MGRGPVSRAIPNGLEKNVEVTAELARILSITYACWKHMFVACQEVSPSIPGTEMPKCAGVRWIHTEFPELDRSKES